MIRTSSAAAKFVFKEVGNDGKGNDPFDVNDREQGDHDSDRPTIATATLPILIASR